ncbi:hypothetical protein [Actinoplanes subglobosus]|uniref:DUF779 domain-containing protein n=1 Tax=Actinoplanes subglobosus TaxID=1547892 RepID=A0ABV8IZQ6_9ACTN
MDSRMLTGRERAVLEALLAVDFDGAPALRGQAAGVRVVGGCGCGCPSIEFVAGGVGMRPRVNAFPDGSYSSLFLYTMVDAGGVEVLGGIEWAGIDESPDQFPPPGSLTLEAA